MRKIFWIYLIVMCLVMVWYIPPFQKADEVTHFKSASVLAGGKSWMILSRLGELSNKLKTKDIAFKYDNKFDGLRLWEKDDNVNFVKYDFNLNLKNYISYFPVEIGVWIGSFTAYPILSLYFGRMMGLMLFVLCIWLSLKLIPKKYSGIIVAYAIVPMVIHQGTEVSYDVFLLCLAPLILSIFMKLFRAKSFWKWFGLLFVLISLFTLVKSGYYLMFLLLPIILWGKYRDKIIERPWIISIVILSSLPVLIYFLRFLSSSVNGSYQFEILKHDPWQLFRIMNETWIAQREFYVKSMLGYFGWLDYQFDVYQYLMIFGIIVALLAKLISLIKKPITDWFGFIVIGLIIFGTYFLIEIGFLVHWTKIGSIVIDGVQGRYLLPLLPLLFFWISQFFVLLGKKKSKIFVFGLVGYFLIGGMIDKIYYRYYDLSSNLRNKDEIVTQLRESAEQKLEKTFLSSKSKFNVNFHTGDGDVLGGFEILTERNGNIIGIPYRYSIKDKDCTRELTWGYLDNTRLNKDNIYLQKFDALKLGYRDICFQIEPIVNNDKEKYFDFVLIDEDPVVKLKFISKEVNL